MPVVSLRGHVTPLCASDCCMPRRSKALLVLVALVAATAAAVCSGPPAGAGSDSDGITLHVRLNAPRPVDITDTTLPVGKLYVGQGVALSARLSDGLSGEPLAGARAVFGLSPDAANQPSWVAQNGTSQAAAAFTDQTGLARVNVLADPTLLPGPFLASVEGPMVPVNGIEYERSRVEAAGTFELWDTTSLSLEVSPSPGAPGSSLVSGRLTTSHGINLPLPISVYIDGTLRKEVTAGKDGVFTWSAGKLADGFRAFRVVFRGQRYLDGCEAKTLFDPSLDNWKVDITTAKSELDLPETGARLDLTLTGPGWPPANPFSLGLVATDREGKTYPLGEVPASSQRLAADVELPPQPGLYTIRAEMIDPGPDRHNRLGSESVTVSVWAVTSLSLHKVTGKMGSEELHALLTYFVGPDEWERLNGMPCVITWNDRPVAEGITVKNRDYGWDGEFVIFGREPMGQGGLPPFDPGEYQARFDPPAGVCYRPSASGMLRIGPGPGGLSGRPLLLVLAFLGLMGVAAGFGMAALLRRAAATRRRSAGPGFAEPGVAAVLPPEVIRGLAPREQLIHLYEWLVAVVLDTVLAPNPTWGQWAYWRRLSRALPEAKEPLRNLLVLYQEARYSDHPIAHDQAEKAWQLAGSLVALVSPEGGLAT